MDGVESGLFDRAKRSVRTAYNLMVEKRVREEEDERNGIKKSQPRKRRKKIKKAESGESGPATPAESAKQMLKQRAFSKKIDYSAMDRLFADD